MLGQRSKNTREESLRWVVDRCLSLLFLLDLSCPLLCHDDHTDPLRVLLPDLPCALAVYIHRAERTGAYGDEERRRARDRCRPNTKALMFLRDFDRNYFGFFSFGSHPFFWRRIFSKKAFCVYPSLCVGTFLRHDRHPDPFIKRPSV